MLGSWESANGVTFSVACAAAFSGDVELNRANDKPETDAGGKYELAFNRNRPFRLVDRIGREAMDDNYRQRVSFQSDPNMRFSRETYGSSWRDRFY